MTEEGSFGLVDRPTVYIVQSGDTPTGIASRVGVSLLSLLHANPQKPVQEGRNGWTWTSLMVGEEITLPLPSFLGQEQVASGSYPNDTEEGVQKAQDDEAYDTLMGRENNNADRCARGVATTYFTGTAKPEDYGACMAHLKELYNDPKGTIFETTGITAGKEVYGCGATCGGVLGFFLGPHVTEWIGDIKGKIFGQDCQEQAVAAAIAKGKDGVGEYHIHRDAFRDIQIAAADDEAVKELNSAAFSYALDVWNVGLKQCAPEEWFRVRTQQVYDQANAIAVNSTERVRRTVLDRAAQIYEHTLKNAPCQSDACKKALANASFAKAAVESKLNLDYALLEHNFIIDTGTNRESFLASPQFAEIQGRAITADKETNKLLAETAGGTLNAFFADEPDAKMPLIFFNFDLTPPPPPVIVIPGLMSAGSGPGSGTKSGSILPTLLVLGGLGALGWWAFSGEQT